MYKNPFFLDKAIWNNAFCFEKRTNKKLYVPSLKKINNFCEINLQKDDQKIAFEDFGFDDKLSTNYWLENFYEINWQNKKIYLFDNHNHALFFWYLSKEKWLINTKNNVLYHVDEHADYRDPCIRLEKNDLESIFDYTNFSKINVGNYIIPSEKEGLIWKTIQIRNTKNLEDYIQNDYLSNHEIKNNIILDLDLDFFQPALDFISYDLKKKVILDIASKASIITVASSPFFVNQELAIDVFKDIFWSET